MKSGYNFKNNPEVFKSLASLVNSETGRGSLGRFETSASLLNGVFFAPKYLMSRLNLLNPFYYAKLAKPVRVLAMKDMLKFVGAGVTLVAMAKAAGAEVEVDPRSSDFGKIKVGNTRLDIWGGFQQLIRTAAQITMGQIKTTTGNVRELNGRTFPFTTRWDVMERFVESKFAPVTGFIRDWAANKNYVGQPFELSKEMINYLVPLYIQDLTDAIKDNDLQGGLLTIPAIFGTGVQTYQPKVKEYKKVIGY